MNYYNIILSLILAGCSYVLAAFSLGKGKVREDSFHPEHKYGIYIGGIAFALSLTLFNYGDTTIDIDNEDSEIQEYHRNTDDRTKKVQDIEESNDDPLEVFDLEEYIAESQRDFYYDFEYQWDGYEENAEGYRCNPDEELVPGISVSYYQGKINWSKVKASGIEYALIRIGYRGYETGIIKKDKNFDTYIKGAKENEIKVGVYFFSQALSTSEMDEEIDYMTQWLEGYELDYPVVINVGRTDMGSAAFRTDNLSLKEYLDLQKYFCIQMEEKGFHAMIYDSQDTIQRIKSELGDEVYDGCLLWEYCPDASLTETKNCMIWQYRHYFTVKGISKKVSIGFGKMVE